LLYINIYDKYDFKYYYNLKNSSKEEQKYINKIYNIFLTMRFKNSSFRLSTYSLQKELQKSMTAILGLNSNEIEYIFDMDKYINKVNLLTLPRYNTIKNCMLLRVSIFIRNNLLFINLLFIKLYLYIRV